ncbi:MAG: hypothetical protein MJD61_16885 [Proteobacteria bacterium]|nr:hypothetical protein [Pseudomonadota bacterium]
MSFGDTMNREQGSVPTVTLSQRCDIHALRVVRRRAETWTPLARAAFTRTTGSTTASIGTAAGWAALTLWLCSHVGSSSLRRRVSIPPGELPPGDIDGGARRVLSCLLAGADLTMVEAMT